MQSRICTITAKKKFEYVHNLGKVQNLKVSTKR